MVIGFYGTIKKNIIAIYIKNCILVNDNRVSFDLIDEESSSSSIEFSSDSHGSNKEKENEKNKEFENNKSSHENNIINDNQININTYLACIHLRRFRPEWQKGICLLLLLAYICLHICWWGIKYLPFLRGISLHTY